MMNYATEVILDAACKEAISLFRIEQDDPEKAERLATVALYNGIKVAAMVEVQK